MVGLGDTFLSLQRETWDARVEDPRALSMALAERASRARSAWPGVSLSDEDFLLHLAACTPDETDPSEAIAALHTDDLFLACACARGDAHALQHFERRVLPRARPAIARIDPSAGFVDETLHDVRVRLLVEGEDGPARITRYLGRGPLDNWVCVVAMRAAHDRKRAERSDEIGDEALLAAIPFEGTSPELASVRADFSVPFRAAFAAALASLETRERNVLRLYLLEDVSSEVIGTMYGVHRATVARWIAGAHQQLLSETRRRLTAQLGVIGKDLDTLMRVAASGLEISIATGLRT